MKHNIQISVLGIQNTGSAPPRSNFDKNNRELLYGEWYSYH